MNKLCIRCGGTGEYLGMGMIVVPCNLCDDDGYERESSASAAPTLDKVDRRSKAYKQAINNLMDSQGLTREEATELFDDTYNEV